MFLNQNCIWSRLKQIQQGNKKLLMQINSLIWFIALLLVPPPEKVQRRNKWGKWSRMFFTWPCWLRGSLMPWMQIVSIFFWYTKLCIFLCTHFPFLPNRAISWLSDSLLQHLPQSSVQWQSCQICHWQIEHQNFYNSKCQEIFIAFFLTKITHLKILHFSIKLCFFFLKCSKFSHHQILSHGLV